MVACLSPNGSTLSDGKSLPETMVVATLEGVVTARRVGTEWEVLSRALTDKHVSSVAYEPLTDTLLAGSYSGGIHVSGDGGITWGESTPDLASSCVFTIACRVVDGVVTLYAGTEPVALYRSSDMGLSWTRLDAISHVPGTEKWTFPAPPHVAHLKSITFDPRDERTFYACVEQGGLFLTTDGGESFEELSGIEMDDDSVYKDAHRLVADPADPDRLFMTGGDGLTASEDGGRTWNRALTRRWEIGYPDALIAHPRKRGLMFMAGATRGPGSWRETATADAHVARTRDGGQTWEITDSGLPSPLRGNIEAMSLSCADDESLLHVATTDGEVYESWDEGDGWHVAIKGLAPISKGGHYRNLRPGAKATS